MDRDTGMTVSPITSVSAFRLSILTTQGHARVLDRFLLYQYNYFQLGCVQTYTDFHVWRGTLATNVNPVTAPCVVPLQQINKFLSN